MVSGAAKTTLIERDVSARASSLRGVYVGFALPAVCGPLEPTLVTGPTQFLNLYTPEGRVAVGMDSAYLEILTALGETNKIWVARAARHALHSAAYLRASASSLVNAATEFGFENPDADYDMTTTDGRPYLAPAAATFDAAQDLFSVPSALYAGLDTGDAVRLSTTGILPAGLNANQNYFVWKAFNGEKIGLATSLQNANDGTLIDLTSFGVGTHTMTAQGKSLTGGAVANPATDTFALDPSLLATIDTGDSVQLTSTGTRPSGVGSGTYYAIRVQDGVKLATNSNNAFTGVALDLVDAGTGALTLSITADKDVAGFCAVDMSDDTLTVSPLFYSASRTGDQVTMFATTGALPAAVAPYTTYYLVKTFVENKIKLAVTKQDAQNAVSIDIAGGSFGNYLITNESIVGEGGSNAKVLVLHASDPGQWGNNVSFKLTNYATNPTRVREPNAFLIEVYYKTTKVESWTVSRDPNQKDARGQAMYVEEVLKGSRYVRALDNVAVPSTTKPRDQLTLLSLANGDDGDVVTDDVMISALNSMGNPAEITLALVADSGWTTAAYQNAIVSFCERRGDCAGILSTPYEVESQADYLNSVIDYKAETLNSVSSYAAMFSSHLLVQDTDNNRQLYISPSCYVAGRIAKIWDTFNAWQPAAGVVYGQLNVLGVKRAWSDGEMDALYDASVNPIRWKRGGGATIWGQKTLQTRSSDLDRLNARLLLCVLRPAIKDLLDQYLFSLNTLESDKGTRATIVAVLSNYMAGIKSAGGVYDYKVVCSDENNSPDDVDNHQLNVWVLIKITKSVEYINVTLGITPTGIDFALAESSLATA